MKTREEEISEYYKELGEVLTPAQKKKGLLLNLLHEIQKEFSYLPREVLEKVSRELDLPLAEIYSTASFYRLFSFIPKARNIVCVCTGTACHVRGATDVLKGLEKSLGLKVGQSSEDGSVMLDTVDCVGCCGLAPVISVNEEAIGGVDPLKVDKVIAAARDEMKLWKD